MHRQREGQRLQMDVLVLRGVVQHRVEVQFVHLGHRTDVAGQRLRHLDMLLALQPEQVRHLERLAAAAHVELAALRHRALVHAEDAELADEGIGGDLEDMGQHMLAGVGLGMHQPGVLALAVQEVRRVAFGRVGQQLDDHVEQFGHAGAAARRDEAHRNQVALAQRLLQRRVKFAGVDVAVVEIAIDEIGIDLDHLLHQRAVGIVDRAEIAVPLAVEEAIHHLAAARIGQVQRQAFLAEGLADLSQHRLQVHALRIDLVDDDDAVDLSLGGVFHHAQRHRLDAGHGVDDDGRRFHRLQRRQRLADEIGGARGVDEVHAGAGVVQMHHRRVERMAEALFQRIVVADGAATFQRAGRGDGAGVVQQRFGQAGLAGRGRAHQGQGADRGDGFGAGVPAAVGGWA